MLRNKKIVVTGGSGRFGKNLKKYTDKNFLFPSKKKLNILNLNSIVNFLKKNKPRYLIHLAGLSRPIIEHEKNIIKSINLNIIGTSNIVIACSKLNIKVIYFSSSYVYPGTKGNYNESDPLLPMNNYAWSKLGGESAVQMYKNSLILRVSMTERPFVHSAAYANMITNFIFHEDFIILLKKIIHRKGILNIGGKTQTVYNFARKFNKKLKKIYIDKKKVPALPKNSSMNLNKIKKLIN